ncbi:TPA: hypothetical protein ACGBG5_002536 [Enterococcus faecalis]
MEKIIIQENKKLKLVNVLVKELRRISADDIQNEIRRFMNFLEVAHIQIRGPLITRTIGTHIDSIEGLLIDYDIMIQTVRTFSIENYKFLNSLSFNNCLYVHYKGNQDELTYIQTKFELYVWENNLISTGEEIIVHLDTDNEKMTVDVFRPMVNFNENL